MWKRMIAGLIVVVSTGFALAWWLGWLGEDPALAEVKAMQAKLADVNLSEADFRATMEQVRAKMDSLSEVSRRAAWQNSRQLFDQREQSRIDRILAMKPQERTRALDNEINRMERWRADRQQRAAQSGGGQRGPGSNTGAPRSRGGQSDEQRLSRLRNRLDNSSPEQRAKRSEYARLINERRAQRGLPPMQRGRG